MKTFTGNFFEIGKQLGKLYKKNRMSFKNIKIDKKLYKSQLKIYKKFYPELIEELKGVAEAGKYDEDKVIYKFITSELRWYIQRFKLKRACTIFGVKNKNGFFVGRNYEWIKITEKIFQAYKVVNKERNSFIGVSDMSIDNNTELNDIKYDVDDAINDKGLYVGVTFAYNNKWSYGLSSLHMSKLIAEKCSTVDEALKLFKKIPICCPKYFFIADKKGNMAVVEHTSKRFKVRYPKDGILIQTNHYHKLKEEDKVLIENPRHTTFDRYDEVMSKIDKNFKFSDVIRVLGDTNSCICQDLELIRTIWSLSLDMKNRKYKLYWNLFGKRKSKKLMV